MEPNQSYYDLLVVKSLKTLERTKYASIGLFCCGLLAFSTNILIIITIIRGKNLHNRCFWLVANLAVADWLVGVAYMGTGVKRIIRLTYGIPEVNSQVHCCAEMSLAFFRYCLWRSSDTCHFVCQFCFKLI